jgi:hypothetical protein
LPGGQPAVTGAVVLLGDPIGTAGLVGVLAVVLLGDPIDTAGLVGVLAGGRR